MAMGHWCSKELLKTIQELPVAPVIQEVNTVELMLHNRISELEHQLSIQEPIIVEKINEVVRTIEVPVEKIIVQTIEVPIEKIVDRVVEVIKHVEVPVEKLVYKEISTIKEVPVYLEKLVDREIEIVKEVEKEIKVIPKIVFTIMAVEALMIILLLLKH